MGRNVPVMGLLFVLSLSFCGSSFAQTKVIKINAAKTNDYGVRYVLPKTILTVTVEYSQIQKKAGPYAKYASRYLGIPDEDVPMEDRMYYTLDRISITEKGIPDKSQSFLVMFKPKTAAPFVCLTEEGLLCSINAEYQPENLPVAVEDTKTPATGLPELNLQSVYTEEYLHAGSVGKRAEIAARNIYRIRESRQDLLTGEVENVPKDGEAMKIILGNLDAQEKLWTELFTGTSETKSFAKDLVIEPVAEVNKEILFRFSKYMGVVDADNLSGAPVYWNLRDLRTVDIPTPDPKKRTKEPQSIVYNVPGKAEIEIYTADRKMGSTTVNVTQFGTSAILATELVEDKKGPVQIHFYPNTGAIRQISQPEKH
jgi:hypothetical protein